MKANTVFAVTMGKMSKIDTNSAAIAANAEEIAEVREIAEGATAGAPIPKSLASEMVEGGVYLYTGSETGYNAGHVYYYVDGTLTDGGQYGGTTVDTTLTVSGAAADAKVTGDKIAQIKEDLSDLQEQIVSGGGSGFSEQFVTAFSNFLDHLSGVFDDQNGQIYVDALKNALQSGESTDDIILLNGILYISETASVAATQSGSVLTLA